MKILIGTGNPSKARRLAEMLGRVVRADFVSPGELGLQVSWEESGSSPAENARLKAEAFHRASGLPVLCEDSGLYFREFSPEDPRQPGIHVRRVGGRNLSDEEMIAYYSALARDFGPLHACYLDAYAVCDAAGRLEVFCQGGPGDREFFDAFGFLLCDQPHPRRAPGWPLDSLSKHPYLGKYYYDLSPEELQAPGLTDREAAKARFNGEWDRFMGEFFHA